MPLDDPIPNFGSSFCERIDSGKNNSGNIWDYSDSEAASAYGLHSPNKSLLYPVDIGRCTCIILKEKSVDGINGGSVYTLYTNVQEEIRSRLMQLQASRSLSRDLGFGNIHIKREEPIVLNFVSGQFKTGERRNQGIEFCCQSQRKAEILFFGSKVGKLEPGKKVDLGAEGRHCLICW